MHGLRHGCSVAVPHSKLWEVAGAVFLSTSQSGSKPMSLNY